MARSGTPLDSAAAHSRARRVLGGGDASGIRPSWQLLACARSDPCGGRAGKLLTWQKLSQQGADAGADLVADLAYHLDRLPGRVGQVPVFVALAGEDRAGVAAAHGDHYI